MSFVQFARDGKSVPWGSWQEWRAVYGLLYAPGFHEQQDGLHRVEAPSPRLDHVWMRYVWRQILSHIHRILLGCPVRIIAQRAVQDYQAGRCFCKVA